MYMCAHTNIYIYMFEEGRKEGESGVQSFSIPKVSLPDFPCCRVLVTRVKYRSRTKDLWYKGPLVRLRSRPSSLFFLLGPCTGHDLSCLHGFFLRTPLRVSSVDPVKSVVFVTYYTFFVHVYICTHPCLPIH